MIKKKLRLVEENKGEIPALHFAARVSDVDVCRRLVDQGADVNEKFSDFGATPLHYAAMNAAHGESIIDYLVEKGLAIDEEDAHPCQFGNLEMCKWLLEEVKIDVNRFEETDWKEHILIDAAVNRKNEANGHLINEICEDGGTILHLAAQFGSVEMCWWLINQGQDINILSNKTFDSFLHYAALNFINGEDIIKEFGKNVLGGYVNQINTNFFTPLHFAMFNRRQHVEVAEALLELGADLNVKWKGNNLLHFCIVAGKLECAKFVDAKDKNLIKKRGEGGKTTLHIAVDYFNEEICEWLVVIKGANPRELSVGQKSVLELTSREEVKKCLQSLINRQGSEIVS
ncbi:putative ankyrin repeat protein RF_0381 [Cloeon dipterum]|uniref:putative ankyrin repeat protein RF_0381 n=1 Tax=Cloeon dipterum TaxID=197152 RepID=UPI0032206E26